MSSARLFRRILPLFLLAAIHPSAYASDPAFAPISAAELAIKEVPGAPGASAVILDREETTDDNAGVVTVYMRRKILTRDGLKYADIEIPYVKGFTDISDLRARTIHPDGSVVDFTGKPFEKMVIKARDVRFMAKTFTMPDVTVGSIIEYRYKYQRNGLWDFFFGGLRWDLQDDLFTVHEKFHFQSYRGDVQGGGYLPIEQIGISYVYAHFPQGATPPKSKNGQVDVEIANVPAMEAEDYMPPRESLEAMVRFFYGGDELRSSDEFWKKANKYWYDDSEQFIGHRGAIKDAVATMVDANDPPETKARKIYARVQAMRNLSFERDRTEREEKAENIKNDDNAEQVLKRGYGYGEDLNRLYAALARAAGLDATIVRASERDDSFFDKNVMSYGQLPAELVLLNIDGKEIFVDPGMKYCGFGKLAWYRTGVTALKLDKNAGTFIRTPDPTILDGMIKRTGHFMLDRDGTLHGELTVQYSNLAAMHERVAERGEDPKGKETDIVDEVKGWFALQSSVHLLKLNSWENSDQPLEATFAIEVPGFATSTGKRLMAPSGIFDGSDEYLFQKEHRMYPVYLHYPFQHYDVITLTVPASMQVESVPGDKTVNNDIGRYATRHAVQGTTLQIQRLMGIYRYYYPLADYPRLHGFMADAKNSDDEPIILTVSDAKKP